MNLRQQQQQQNQEKRSSVTAPGHSQALSFDTISNYFSLPLADAAAQLGVCTSVLKKSCRDNGLDWWPYRKVLSGKSIEDIKKYATRERSKKASQQSNCRLGSHRLPNNEMSKLDGVTTQNLQQQGSKTSQIGRPQNLLNINLLKGVTPADEFKYGFPSDGLSTTSNKWWGSYSPDGYEGTGRDEADTDEDDKNQLEQVADDGSGSVTVDKEKHQSSTEEPEISPHPQGIDLLVALRKRAAEEGRKGLKLGVFHRHCPNKLGKREKTLLIRIFKTSMQNLLMDGSS